MSKTNLATKVDNIITERNELNQLIFNYITDNNLEVSFHENLLAAEESGEYRQLDLEFMALDYMGSE